MSKDLWTNEAILREVLWNLIHNIYTLVEEEADLVREDSLSHREQALKDRLISLQMGPLLTLAAYIDGANGPADWPGLALVNATTGERVTQDLAWSIAEIEGEIIANDSLDNTIK